MRNLLIPTTLSLLLASSGAYAALGSTPSDFGATTRPTMTKRSLAATSAGSAATYTVSTSTLDSGTVVNEYVAANGNVFAVSWKGPFMPDLRTLLGVHFATMTSAAAQIPHAGHSQFSLARPEVVIQSSGHMRAFQGRAWIPADLPAGFSTANIE